MGYCTEDQVRAIGGFGDENDMPTATIETLIDLAAKELNSRINVRVEDEFLYPIDDDTTDTKFYTKYYPIADMYNSFTVGADSVAVTDEPRLDADRTTLTVSDVDALLGIITLASAPDGDVYCTYEYCSVLVVSGSVHRDVELANIYIAAAMCWDNKHKTARSIQMAKLAVEHRNDFWKKAEVIISHITGRESQVRERDSPMKGFSRQGGL